MDAQVLKSLRLERKLTRMQLATEMGLSLSAIGMYEQGRREPDHTILLRFAKVFGVSVDTLLGNDAGRDLDKKALAEDLFNNLMEQNALMFRTQNLTEADYEKLSEAIKMAVDITVERKMKKNGE